SSSRTSRKQSPATKRPSTSRPPRTARKMVQASWRSSSSKASETTNTKRHVDRHPLFRARKYHCCRGLQPDRCWPPEGDNRGRHAGRRAAAAVAVHGHQISRHAAEHAVDLEQLAAGTGGRKDLAVPHAIDAGDARHGSRPL